jgi:hypothetical protein
LCLNRWKNKCIYLSLAFYYTAAVFISCIEIGIHSLFNLGHWSYKEVPVAELVTSNNVLCKKTISGMDCTSSAVTSKNNQNGSTGKLFNAFLSPP